jgi:hypothetical protein
MSGCLSELALDDRELHGATDPGADAHIASCASCQARLETRRARVVEFQATWQGPTWSRIEAEARAGARRRRWGRAWLLAVPGLAIASVLLFVSPRPPPAVRGPTAKGSALVEIVCRREGQVFPIGPADEVVAGDALRFRPLPRAGARFIQVGSIDGTGAYAPFYPPDAAGVSVPLPPAGAPLDGSIRLDDAPGPERLFVVLSSAPLPVRDVARAALAGAANGDRVDQLAGVAVSSAWIVLPKRGVAAPGR